MASEVPSILNGSVSQYGSVVAAGKARVHMGDIHHYQNTVSTESSLDKWRGRFFDALAYDDMNGKSQQLDSIDASTASFDWVETTAIPVWLEQRSSIFWISGKPGSGKSVLMKHLVSTHSTKQHLGKWKQNCVILEFFFDFRAAKSEANDISGMLKLFLRQLSSQSDVATKHFRQLIDSEELRDADVAKLSNLLSSTVRRCDLPVCAFVDGLDEYEGDWVDLIDVLQRLQDRTGMKICLASRPEPQLKQLLSAYSSISMQDHNVASLRVYIERALIRARRLNPDIGAKFTERLKDEIALKAQGIILWARLAVDELIRACNSGKSLDEMQQIFNALPAEVEDMYRRILAKLHYGYAAESAVVFDIIGTWSGGIALQELYGIWDLFVEDFSIQVEGFSSISMSGFCERMDFLLGTLVDLLPDDQIRLLHRTLHDYLRATAWVDQNLPQRIKELFPHHKRTRIHAYFVRRATADDIVVSEKLDNFLVNNGLVVLNYNVTQRALWGMCNFRGGVHWPRRISMLTESVMELPSDLEDTPNDTDLFAIVLSALKSPLMLLACRSRYFCHNRLQMVFYGPAYRSVVDMIVAVGVNNLEYARWRLQTPLVDLAQIQALLDASIDRMLGSQSDNQHTAAFEVASAMVSRGARRTRYHPCLIMSHFLSDCERLLHMILETLSSCPQDLNTGFHCDNCFHRRRSIPPLFEWVEKFDRMDGLVSISHSILRLILNSEEPGSGRYYSRRASSDAALRDHLLCHTNSSEEQRISWKGLCTLREAGIDVQLEDTDGNPYKHAKESESASNSEPASKNDTNQVRNELVKSSSPRPGQYIQKLRQLFGKQDYKSKMMTQVRNRERRYDEAKSEEPASSSTGIVPFENL